VTTLSTKPQFRKRKKLNKAIEELRGNTVDALGNFNIFRPEGSKSHVPGLNRRVNNIYNLQRPENTIITNRNIFGARRHSNFFKKFLERDEQGGYQNMREENTRPEIQFDEYGRTIRRKGPVVRERMDFGNVPTIPGLHITSSTAGMF
jgi:hypothetical protein